MASNGLAYDVVLQKISDKLEQIKNETGNFDKNSDDIKGYLNQARVDDKILFEFVDMVGTSIQKTIKNTTHRNHLDQILMNYNEKKEQELSGGSRRRHTKRASKKSRRRKRSTRSRGRRTRTSTRRRRRRGGTK